MRKSKTLTETITVASPAPLSALVQLNVMVNRVTKQSRSEQFRADAAKASTRLTTATQAYTTFQNSYKTKKSAIEKSLGDIADDKKTLAIRIKELAQFRSELDDDAKVEADQLIATSQQDLLTAEKEQRELLGALRKEMDAVRAEFVEATESYKEIREAADRMELETGFLERSDQLLESIQQGGSLGSQAISLYNEVMDMEPYYRDRPREEQKHLLTVWIARCRLIQFQINQQEEEDRHEKAVRVAQDTFRRLKAISSQYQPGYIDAFRLEFEPDWILYLQEAMQDMADYRAAMSR